LFGYRTYTTEPEISALTFHVHRDLLLEA
jgi:hypothetical protein